MMRKVVPYTILILWTILCLIPLCWVLVTSFKDGAAIDDGPFYVPFFDFLPTLESWIFILTDPNDNLKGALFNSVLVSVAATICTLLFGSMAVYALTRFRFRLPFQARDQGLRGANQAIFIAILATRILPPIVVVLPLYVVAQITGTLDTPLALIVTYTGANLPVAIWLLHYALGRSVTDQEEAAQIDGASHILIFSTIVLPMAAAGIAAVGLLVFFLCWNEYLFAAYLATDHAMTVPTYLVGQMSIKEAQVGGDSEEWSRFSACAILFAALPLLGAIGAQKLLARARAKKF